MARCQIVSHVVDAAGNAISGAKVFVYNKGTTTAPTDVYAAETGGAPVTFAISNAQGEVTLWKDAWVDAVDLLTTDNATTAVLANHPDARLAFVEFTERVLVQPAFDTFVSGSLVNSHDASAAAHTGTFVRVNELAYHAKDYAATAAQRAVLADGNAKPLSGFYATLTAAQVDYPAASALTDELDWAVAQKAINALPATLWNFDARGGGTVLLSLGEWRVNRALTLNNNVHLRGLGNGTTILVDYNGPGVKVTATDSFGKRGWGVHNLKMMCTSTTTGAIGIQCVAFGAGSGGHIHSSLDNVQILGTEGAGPVRGQFLTGLDLDFFIEDEVRHVYVLGNASTTGVILRNASNATHFYACKFRAMGTGVRIEGNSLPFFTGCTIEGNTVYGMNVVSGSPRMTDMHFENSPGSVDLRVVGGQSGSFVGGEIVNIEMGVGGAPNQVNDWVIAGVLVRGNLNIGTGCLNTTIIGGQGGLTDNGVDTNFINCRFNAATRSSSSLQNLKHRINNNNLGIPAASADMDGKIFIEDTTFGVYNLLVYAGGTRSRLRPSGIDATTVADAAYTAVVADAGKVIRTTFAGASTLTIPTNASVAFPIGTTINAYAAGGALTIAAAAGVTIRNNGAALAQYGEASLRKDAANEWVRVG